MRREAPTPEADASAAPLIERADAARTRLATALGALERRGRHALDVRSELVRYARLARGVIVAFTAATAVAVVVNALVARRHRARARWRMLERAWTHPERVAVRRRGTVSAAIGAIGRIAGRLLLGYVAARMSSRDADGTGDARLVAAHPSGDGR
jgi:hypothetical protein